MAPHNTGSAPPRPHLWCATWGQEWNTVPTPWPTNTLTMPYLHERAAQKENGVNVLNAWQAGARPNREQQLACTPDALSLPPTAAPVAPHPSAA